MAFLWGITIMERSAELLLKEDNTVELIRRKEEPKDYFATLDLDAFKHE